MIFQVNQYSTLYGYAVAPAPPAESQPPSLLRERLQDAYWSGAIRVPRYLHDWRCITPEIKAVLREMLTHHAVKAALLSKAFAVASLDLQIHPADETDADRQVADFHAYAFERAEGGPAQIALAILLGALVDGFSVVECPLQPIERGKWQGKWAYSRIKDKDTERLELVADRFRNITGVAGWGAGQRVIYPANSPDSNLVVTSYLPIWSTPAGMSDLRAAYGPWYRSCLAEQYRNFHLQKFTSPMLKGVYPRGDTQVKRELEGALSQAQSQTWITIPEDTQVEAMQLASRGEGEFAAAIKDYTDQIVLSITGATLQMLVANAGGDLRGDSKTQNSTAELTVWYLRQLVTNTYNRWLIPLQTDVNFPGVDYPTASLGSVNDADLTPSLQIDQGLAGLGVPLSKAALAKTYGRQLASDPADQVGGGTAPEPATPFADQEGVAAPVPYTLDMGPLWKVRQVAQALNFSPGKIRDLCRLGELGYVPFGASLRVPERSLNEYVERCKAKGGGSSVPFAEVDSFCQEGPNAGKPGRCPKTPEEKGEATAKAKTSAGAVIARIKAKGGTPSAEDVAALRDHLSSLPVAHIQEVKRALGIKAAGPKAELAQKVAERALQGRSASLPQAGTLAGGAAPAAAAPPTPRGTPVSKNGQPAGSSGNKTLPDHSRPKLNGKESSAVEDYTDTGFKTVNAALRSGQPLTGEAARVHAGMEAAFAKAEVFPEPVPTFRGMNLDAKQLTEFAGQVEAAARTGGVVKMTGHTSTATGGVPKGFEGNVEIRIRATHGLDARPHSVNAAENELILRHNSGFRVDKVERDPAGKLVVHMTQVTHG